MPRACEYSPNCRCTADSCQTADRLSLHRTLLTHPLRRLNGLTTGADVHPCHICTGTGLTPATSAPGLDSPRVLWPHLHRDWAHPCHIGTGTGLAPRVVATSAPGLVALPAPCPAAVATAGRGKRRKQHLANHLVQPTVSSEFPGGRREDGRAAREPRRARVVHLR
jgi:hypothetical protein